MKVEVPNSNVDCVCSENLWSFIIQMFRITLRFMCQEWKNITYNFLNICIVLLLLN